MRSDKIIHNICGGHNFVMGTPAEIHSTVQIHPLKRKGPHRCSDAVPAADTATGRQFP